MNFDLSIIWFVIIVFGTIMYIVMDGFDLGVGILMPIAKDMSERDTMVNTVAPVWDGNETWLVLGGAALYGAFPLAYSIILDSLSIPLTLMLVCLIFRGVAFEFRLKAFNHHQLFWERAFVLGSIGAAFCQGIVVGSVVQGFAVQNQNFVGSPWDWLAPFPIFCGLALVITYALLGATWLVMKTENRIQQHCYTIAMKLLALLIICIALVSIWTVLSHPNIGIRWFSAPHCKFLWSLPVLTLASVLWAYRALALKKESAPFFACLLIVLLGFIGLGVSIWPSIIPPDISIWQASAPEKSQSFMLVGALFILPFILAYIFWSYYVFNGKVKSGEMFH